SLVSWCHDTKILRCGDNTWRATRVCYTVGMQDTARHGALQPANDGLRHTLSVNDVAAQLLAAGVPRSRRHIVRLCKSSLFDANRPEPDARRLYAKGEGVDARAGK